MKLLVGGITSPSVRKAIVTRLVKKRFYAKMIIYCMGDTGGPGPEIFVLQSDEGARENTVQGPGTPVLLVQYTIL